MTLDFDQQTCTTMQEEISIVVAMGQIAGSQPPIGTDSVGRRSWVAPVTEHHVLTPGAKHANGIRGQFSI